MSALRRLLRRLGAWHATRATAVTVGPIALRAVPDLAPAAGRLRSGAPTLRAGRRVRR